MTSVIQQIQDLVTALASISTNVSAAITSLTSFATFLSTY